MKTSPSNNEEYQQLPHLGSFTSQSATSGRAIALGLILGVANVIWVVTLEQSRLGVYPSFMTYHSTVLFTFFWLILANIVFRRYAPGRALTRGELLTIFCLTSISTPLAGVYMVPVLAHLLMEGTHQVLSAITPIRDAHLVDSVPLWMRVSDPVVISAYFRGHSSLFSNNYYQVFLAPFFWWALFIVCLLLMAFSANTILRRQWSRSERLTFPITQLPIAMSAQSGNVLLKSRGFWIGFAIAGGVTILNGLNYFFPGIPSVPTKSLGNLRDLSSSPVWQSVGITGGGEWINMSPFILGVAYLIPLDLLFSFWFFFWVWRLERFIGASMAIPMADWSVNGGYPYYAEQMIGVWLAILSMMLWAARFHLKGVIKQALRPGSGADDSGEPIRYRWAMCGLLCGFGGIVAFLSAAGIPVIMVIPYTLLLLGVMVIISRIRAELGPPQQDLLAAGPDRVIGTFVGPLTVGTRPWVTFQTMTFWLHHFSYMTHPSGTHIDTLRIAEVGGGLNRRFWIATLAAGVLGGLVAFWYTLHIGFQVGPLRGYTGSIANCYSFCIWRGVQGVVDDVTPRPQVMPVVAMGLGYLGALGLFFVRNIGVSIPLNPIGYLITGGVNLGYYWFPFLLIWMVKGSILRYGGLRLYRTLLPFFFGLILGEFVLGVCWQMLGMIFKIKTYSFV